MFVGMKDIYTCSIPHVIVRFIFQLWVKRGAARHWHPNMSWSHIWAKINHSQSRQVEKQTHRPWPISHLWSEPSVLQTRRLLASRPQPENMPQNKTLTWDVHFNKSVSPLHTPECKRLISWARAASLSFWWEQILFLISEPAAARTRILEHQVLKQNHHNIKVKTHPHQNELKAKLSEWCKGLGGPVGGHGFKSQASHISNVYCECTIIMRLFLFDLC